MYAEIETILDDAKPLDKIRFGECGVLKAHPHDIDMLGCAVICGENEILLVTEGHAESLDRRKDNLEGFRYRNLLPHERIVLK